MPTAYTYKNLRFSQTVIAKQEWVRALVANFTAIADFLETPNAEKIAGVLVDDTDIGNNKILMYNSSTGKLEYESILTPGGSTSHVQYNNGGTFAGTANFTANSSGEVNCVTLTASGLVTANEFVGTVDFGNIIGVPDYAVVDDQMSFDGGDITSDGDGFFSAQTLDSVTAVFAGSDINYLGWLNYNSGSINYDRLQADDAGNVYCYSLKVGGDSGHFYYNPDTVTLDVPFITGEFQGTIGTGVTGTAAGLTVGTADHSGTSDGSVADFTVQTYLHMPNISTYANNAAAISGGLSAGNVYKTATGELRIVV